VFVAVWQSYLLGKAELLEVVTMEHTQDEMWEFLLFALVVNLN
jgi:hypothetical protein